MYKHIIKEDHTIYAHHVLVKLYLCSLQRELPDTIALAECLAIIYH